MTTTRRKQGGHDASFSSSLASSRHKGAYPPASYSAAQIVEDWKIIFGPGSDLFEPGDPRGILGGITPIQVREQLDAQTAEVVKLRAEVAEMKRRVHKEQQELKTQVNFFATRARAAARQAKSEGTDSLALQKMAHEREMARVRRAHEYEIAAWKGRVEALEQEQQQQQPSFPIPPPSSSGQPQSSSARLQSTSSSTSRRPFASIQTSAPSSYEKEEQKACRSAYKAAGRREDKEEEEEAPRPLPIPIPSLNFPVRSTEEQSLLEKRLADFEELYEVTRAAMQATAMTTSAAPAAAAAAAAAAGTAGRVGGREGKGTKDRSEESKNEMDFTLGSVDVYPGQTAARAAVMGVGEEGGRSGGGGEGRTPPVPPPATTRQRKRTLMTAQQGRRSATTPIKSNTFGDRAFTRLDPTQYPTSVVSNPSMPPPIRRSNAGMREPRNIWGTYKPLVTAEEEENDEEEEEEEEESEDEAEEEGEEEGEEEEGEKSGNEDEGCREEMESSEVEEEDESRASGREDYDDDDDEEGEGEEEYASESESEEGDWLEDDIEESL